MYKRWIAAWLAVLLLLCGCAAAEEQKVFMVGETEAFGEEENLLTLHVCPIAGADSMLLTYGEHSMLIDTGKRTDIEQVVGMVQAAGLEKVDMIFNTHPHSDHIGGVIPLIGRVPFDQFMTLFPHDYTGSAIVQRSTIKALDEAGIPVMDMQDGDTIPFGDVSITVMRQTTAVSDNNTSAMLLIEYGACTLLLTADVEPMGQWYLLQEYDMKADIVKFPHHAVTRMNPEFIAETQPEFVFIPHGSQATKEAQKQLNKEGIPFMFATWGPITIQCNGEKWIVEQQVFEKYQSYAEQY